LEFASAMEDVVLIETQEQWERLLDELGTLPCLAIDTESNGFFAYHERICLIQISTEATDYILDPLAVVDLGGLNRVFADPGIEKVFHAAANDISGLKRDFSFEFASVFDTAVACKMIGHRRLGLAHILEDHFGVELNKKWQRCDWGRRPLSDEQLRYARLDTHYLLPLRRQLLAELEAQDLLAQAREAFAGVCQVPAQEPRFLGNGINRIHGAGQLNRAARAVLRTLCRHRDQMARQRDRAPFRILGNETLLRLAERQPRDLDELYKIKGLPKTFRKGAQAKRILSLIRQGRSDPDPASASPAEPAADDHPPSSQPLE